MSPNPTLRTTKRVVLPCVQELLICRLAPDQLGLLNVELTGVIHAWVH